MRIFPQDQVDFLAINAEIAKTSPIIFAAKEPHPQAEEYRDVIGTSGLFSFNPNRRYILFRFRSCPLAFLAGRRILLASCR